ncbi:MAG: RNA polymerase sigma-54 factor [Deltaproteobacteria bacterium CG03_land_8_20_14_0_80_45_14]|nr:MAG: RNA polymerase sigma-54 factor [Deltaproteobacteria bacterium CG03_land_8_20_14_0_80_45_14]
MVLELKLAPKLVQQLVITPQLQQAIRLLQLTRLELVDMISQEMKENPLLEEEEEEEKELAEGEAPAAEQGDGETSPEPEHTPEVKGNGEGADEFDWENYLENSNLTPFQKSSSDGEESPSFENFLTKRTTLTDHLRWQLQLSHFTEEEHEAGTWIIGNLDENGYLKISLEDIYSETNLPVEGVERVLRKIQQFDPVGVAARDLKECLLIQLGQVSPRDPLAEKIVSEHLSLLKNRNYPAIAKRLGVSLDRVNRAASLISKLDPKPGKAFGGEVIQEIIPDVYVYKLEGDYVITLNDEGIPRLKVNSLYRNILNGSRLAMEGDRKYIQEKLRSALWLIRSIHQRQRTIYKVTKSIVKFQREFLDKGIQSLKPLVLRDVAEDIQMHESTISRVTHNKYVHTPQGIYELKFFFNAGITSTQGETMASESVKNLVREVIAQEDPRKPYSDEKLVQILQGKNIHIARRTISKYREMMKILSSNERRKIV